MIMMINARSVLLVLQRSRNLEERLVDIVISAGTPLMVSVLVLVLNVLWENQIALLDLLTATNVMLITTVQQVQAHAVIVLMDTLLTVSKDRNYARHSLHHFQQQHLLLLVLLILLRRQQRCQYKPGNLHLY